MFIFLLNIISKPNFKKFVVMVEKLKQFNTFIFVDFTKFRLGIKFSRKF